MSIKNFQLFVLLFFLQFNITAQEIYSLQDFHAFASSKDFGLKKVFLDNPDSLSLDTFSLKFSGELHSLRFARNVITLAASVKDLPYSVQTDFEINTLTERSFKELSIIKAIESHYDKYTFYTYLEKRALKAFTGNWQDDAEDLNFDLLYIERLAASPDNLFETFNQFNKNAENNNDMVFLNGNEMYTEIHLYRHFMNTSGYIPCCNFERCFLSCMDSKFDTMLERIVLSVAFSVCTASVTAVTAASGGAALWLSAQALISCTGFVGSTAADLNACINECDNDKCRWPSDVESQECESDEMCISLVEPVFTAPNPDAVFHPSTPFFASEIEPDCVDCPVSTTPEKDVFSDSNFAVDLDWNLPFAAEVTYPPNISDKSSWPTYPWEVFYHVGDKVVGPFDLNRTSELEIDLDIFLGHFPNISVGDVVCLSVEPPDVYKQNGNCVERHCEVVECPNLTIVQNNGHIDIEFVDENLFFWEGSSVTLSLFRPNAEFPEFIEVEYNSITSILTDKPGLYIFNVATTSGTIFGLDQCFDKVSERILVKECDLEFISIENVEVVGSNIFSGGEVEVYFNNPGNYELDIDFSSVEPDYANEFAPFILCDNTVCTFEHSPFTAEYCFSISASIPPGPTTFAVLCDPFELCVTIEGYCPLFPLQPEDDDATNRREECIDYTIDLTNPTGPNKNNGSVTVLFDQSDPNNEIEYYIDWGLGIGAVPLFSLENLPAGEYCFTIFSTEGDECCEVQDCKTLEASCPELIIPNHMISESFCNSNSAILFELGEMEGGTPPYSYKWNNGEETLNNYFIDGSGSYYLTVTDANGCNIAETIVIENEANIPVIQSVNNSGVDCTQEMVIYEINYFLPSYDPNYIYGIEYNLEDGSGDQYAISINESGPGVHISVVVPNGITGKMEIVPFVENSEGEKCKGPGEEIDLPIIEFPDENSLTNIRLEKTDSEDCNPVSEYKLVGYCDSDFGCRITGSMSVDVPKGLFEFDLGYVAGGRMYNLWPKLNRKQICTDYIHNPHQAIISASHEHNPLMLGEENWSDGEDCNCHIFEVDTDDGVSIYNAYNSNPNAIITPTGPNSATVCIESEGLYCLRVVDSYDCEVEFCRELELKEIGNSVTTTASDDPFSPNGQASISLDVGTALPVTWNLGLLNNNVSSVTQNSLELSQLEVGIYEIEVVDANGCSEYISFEILEEEDCSFNDIVKDFSFEELSNGRFKAVIEFQSIDGVDMAQAIAFILSEVTYEWTNSDGYSQSGPILTTEEPGFYCCTITLPCDETLRWCREFSNPPQFLDCPPLTYLEHPDHSYMVASGGEGSEIHFKFDFVQWDPNWTNDEGQAWADAIWEVERNSTFEWSSPTGSSFDPAVNLTDPDIEIPAYGNHYIYPLETGTYCVTVTTVCDEVITDCYEYLHIDDCPVNAVELTSKNSCDDEGPFGLLGNPEICIHFDEFLALMTDLLDNDVDNIYVDVYMDHDDNDYDDYWLKQFRMPRFNGSTGFVNPFDNPTEFCRELSNKERDFSIEINVYLEYNNPSSLLCSTIFPNITFDSDASPCETCELSTDAIGDLEHYDLFFQTDLPVGCACYSACSNVPDATAENIECERYSVTIVGGSTEPTMPCAFVQGMSILCGPTLLSKEVLETQGNNIVDIILSGAYTDCDILETANGDGNCVYKCGCLFEYIDFDGNTQEVLVPSEIVRECPDIDPEDCDNSPSGSDNFACIDFVDGVCLGANTQNLNDPCSTNFEFGGDACEGGFDTPPFCAACDDCKDYLEIETSITIINVENSHNTDFPDYSCTWKLGCHNEGNFEQNGMNLEYEEYEEFDGIDYGYRFCYDAAANNEIRAICGDCEVLTLPYPNETPTISPYAASQLGILPCSNWSDCDTYPVAPDDPVSLCSDNPNFTCGLEIKTITFSEQYDGPPLQAGDEPRETFLTGSYSGYGGIDSENSENYFSMQATHVTCEPVEQFEHCGFNSVYWTTKVIVDGTGAICGSSNMFWRSGWCACPDNPNLSFFGGYMDGTITDNYTNEIDSRTVYTRKTNVERKSTSEKDVVLFGLDGSGGLQSAQTFGGPGDDVATSMVTITPVDGNLATSIGGFAVSGFFDKTINFSDTPSEKLIAAGTDAFIVIFDANGDYVTSRNNLVEGFDVRSKAIMADSEGNFIVVLSVKESAQDLVGYSVIMKLDSQLNSLWMKAIEGGAHSIDPGNIIIHDNNIFSIAGSFTDQIRIGNRRLDATENMHSSFIITLNKNGYVYPPQSFGASNAPIVVTGIKKGSRNALYLAGYYTEDIQFGSDVLSAGAETSSFIAKFNWRGQFDSAQSFGVDGFFQINDLSTDRKDILCIVGEYIGDVTIGGLRLPNNNGIKSGFILPLGDILPDARESNTPSEGFQFVDIDEEKGNSVKVYPNPFKDQLNVEFNSRQSGKIKLEVFYLDGRLILSNEYNVVKGFNTITLEEGLRNVSGVLQLRTSSPDGEVLIDKVIKLE